MQVELAKSAGFCFGVQRAVDTVYKQIEENSAEKIYTYGPIIHNEEVIKDMEKKGVEVILSEEELKQIESGIVIIRSHGVPKRICDLLDENGVRYVDATCPFVKKIHRIVEEKSRDGYHIETVNIQKLWELKDGRKARLRSFRQKRKQGHLNWSRRVKKFV